MNRIVSALGTIALGLLAPAVQASTVGYQLTVAVAGSGGDQPRFTLTNISDTALIQNFTFSINAPGYWFDYVFSPVVVTGPLTATLTTGQTLANETSGTTSIAYSMTSFDPGDAFRFRADLDEIGTADSVTNFRSVFFNNGGPSVPNASASVLFSDGRTLSLTLAGSPGQTSYGFSAFIEVADVPLPATLPLALVGLGGLGLMARRRRKA